MSPANGFPGLSQARVPLPAAWMGYARVRQHDKPTVRICAWCPDKRAAEIEAERIGASITNGICPECQKKLESQIPKPMEYYRLSQVLTDQEANEMREIVRKAKEQSKIPHTPLMAYLNARPEILKKLEKIGLLPDFFAYQIELFCQ